MQFTHSMHAERNKARVVVAATQNEQIGIDKGYRRKIRVVRIDLEKYEMPEVVKK